jgi:hypothetical protein
VTCCVREDGLTGRHQGYLCCKPRVLEFDEFLSACFSPLICAASEDLATPQRSRVARTAATSLCRRQRQRERRCLLRSYVLVRVLLTAAAEQEEFTECRIDHYQTPAQVHVSVFAKKADPERSSVVIEDAQVRICPVPSPGHRRHVRSTNSSTSICICPPPSGSSGPSHSSGRSTAAHPRTNFTELRFGECHKDALALTSREVEVTLQKQDTRSWTVLEKTDLPPGVALTFGVSGRTGTIGSKEFVLDADNRLGRS